MRAGQPAATPAIALAGVDKIFGGRHVLKQISISVDPGQFLVLLGPSGSGKSTMLRCLGGLERVDAGTIHFDGRLVSSADRHVAPERRGLAMVFQDFALWPHLTIQENVAFPLDHRRLGRAETERRVRQILERVGLDAHAQRYPRHLSGGEQQRVALARALVGSPRIVLFDEPLSSLDADLRERLRVDVAELTRQSGASAVYITHDQAEAFALADVVAVLNGGELIQVDRPEVIYGAPVSRFVAQFTGVAGELAGTVSGRLPADRARVDTAAGPLEALLLGPGSDRAREVAVLVRSAPLRLAGPGQHGYLSAMVVDVAFRGRGYDHVVELAPGVRLGGIFAEHRFERGGAVGVSIPPEACLAFASRTPDPARPGPDLVTGSVPAAAGSPGGGQARG